MIQDEIIFDLASFSRDPLGWVLWAFPWGEPGELEAADGPDEWQIWALSAIRDGLLTPFEAIRLAIASGHGIGKSTFVAWVILWALSTMEDARGVVTANTERQLATKTWPELAKWYRLFIARDLFKMEATSIFSVDPEHRLTWRVDMIPWSEKNPAAFAGLHNKGKRIILVFDEASEIDDMIWETAEGALTDADTEIIWTVFGNPTRSVGRFRECFDGGKFAHRWKHRAIDSRTVRVANKRQLQEFVDDYGEDTDFVRVRVLGQFPKQGFKEFISAFAVSEAQAREPVAQVFDPLVIGVDVARFGDDASVIYARKGRDARTWPPIILRGLDTMQVAARAAEEYLRLRADAIFVDGGGVGGGVVDRLRQLRVPVHDINFGSKSDRPTSSTAYANKRAEMWGSLREWLATGSLPSEGQLAAELVGPVYSFNVRNEILLEKKEDMKKRGLSSPDIADALALTFAYPVVPNEWAGGNHAPAPRVQNEYDPFARERMTA